MVSTGGQCKGFNGPDGSVLVEITTADGLVYQLGAEGLELLSDPSESCPEEDAPNASAAEPVGAE